MKALAAKFAFIVSLAIWFSFAQAQNHFNPVGPTADSYSIVVSSALIDGVSLQTTDEIGVFTPAGLCVGAIRLVSPPFTNLPIAAWKDDSQTPAIDGYAVGDTMRFRVWDNSAQRELAAKTAYQLGNGTFENGIYALLSLSATANRPPSVPQLLAPLKGQSATSLKWSKAVDPDIGDIVRYQTQIAPDSSFSTGVISQTTTIEELQISAVSSQLTSGRIYYWRVQALDQQNAGSGFSAKWSFRYDGGLVTAVEAPRANGLPQNFALRQNYPNPLVQSRLAQTVIGFDLPRAEHVSLQIINVLGQHIRDLVNADMPPGSHRVIWNARDDTGNPVKPGFYFYRLKTGKMNVAGRLMVTP